MPATIRGMGDEGLSMQARFEVTKKYAAAYESASKKQKGIILDQVLAMTVSRVSQPQTTRGKLPEAPAVVRA